MKNVDFQQLNIAFVEHDKVWSLCPYHKDTIRPNLSISLLDRYYGRYKCWACGIEGCLTKKQISELNLSTSTIYKNDQASQLTRWQQFTESCYDNLQKFPLLKIGLAKELNVSTKSLDDWLVGYDGGSFTIPMLREDLAEYNKQHGFCGVQRRFPDGTKRCVSGSHEGLMYSHGGVGERDDCMFICEGFSDGISVWDLGFNSIARPHCHYADGIEKFFTRIMDRFDSIVIIPDNDTVGIEGAKKLYSALEYLYEEDYLEDDEYDDNNWDCHIFSFDGAKDIREYIAKKGKDYVKQELRKYIWELPSSK
jgi:hypothetical protein